MGPKSTPPPLIECFFMSYPQDVEVISEISKNLETKE